ncbi:MAG: DUF6049 family protein [bacterium]
MSVVRLGATSPRRWSARRWSAAVLAVAVVSSTAAVSVPPAAAAPSTSTTVAAPTVQPTMGRTPAPFAARTGAAGGPSIDITAIAPAVLDGRQGHDQKLSLRLIIANPGPGTLSGLSVRLERGNPITQEKLLQQALTTPPPTEDVDLAPVSVSGSIAAGSSRTLVMSSTTAQDAGLCLSSCSGNSGVYPIDAALLATETGEELARGHTFLPSFDVVTQPVRVSWIWPLIDRPHRRVPESLFFDDALATSVSSGGRLDRALRVAELVAGEVRMTLLVDPDLIDSLTAMSDGYRVTTGRTTRAGIGGPAAKAWLARLRKLGETSDVALTAYADPDVDAIARAGQTWSPVLDAEVAARVRAVLPANPLSDVSWPAGGVLSPAGLDSVVANGASAVVLEDRALAQTPTTSATVDAVAPLPSAAGEATALVLDTALQKVAAALTARAPATSTAALLDAELAVRAAQPPGPTRFVVLAPDRYVDPDPSVTATQMGGVAASRWARPITVRQAVRSIAPVDHGQLKNTTGGIPARQLTSLARVRTQAASFRECLVDDSDAATLLSGYPAALARGESVAWRRKPAAGRAYTRALRTDLSALIGAVRITQPANASYTLASNNAPLFITVESQLPVPVRVRVQVRTAAGEQGLHIGAIPAMTFPAASPANPIRRQVKVPTEVDRTGRFRISVALATPKGEPISAAVPFRVRSTALGGVALWITGGAFAVLVLALGVRLASRILAGRRGRRPAPGAVST